jgi:hypothetical protein
LHSSEFVIYNHPLLLYCITCEAEKETKKETDFTKVIQFCAGSMSEGIYRRSGANSSVTRLLTLFRQDAWAVQLTRQAYNEYDVASVLKRFLRDLPEPLLTTELHSQLCEIAGLFQYLTPPLFPIISVQYASDHIWDIFDFESQHRTS